MLCGFASAIALEVVSLVMVLESIQRFFVPIDIHFNEAIDVAVVGLIVNIVSAFLLQSNNGAYTHHAHHHDHNLCAAYLHVIADALTSLLAIIALLTGMMLGWIWMDPLMGIVSPVLITSWSWGLLRDTSRLSLDSANEKTVETIRQKLETDVDNRMTNLHLWQDGANRYAAIISLVTQYLQPPEYYKGLLKDFSELENISVKVNQCHGEPYLMP